MPPLEETSNSNWTFAPLESDLSDFFDDMSPRGYKVTFFIYRSIELYWFDLEPDLPFGNGYLYQRTKSKEGLRGYLTMNLFFPMIKK